MDSHFINEPKRTDEQIASARDAWLNKYIKRKSPEPFKYSAKQLNEIEPKNLPGTTVGNLFGIPTTTADTKKTDGSTRVPLPTVNVPYYSTYGQQVPTYNQANNARVTGVDPATVQGTTTGTRNPGMPSTTLPTTVTTSSNIPLPEQETIPIQEPVMVSKVFEEPMDVTRSEVIDETMPAYLPYRAESKIPKETPFVPQYYNDRITRDNLANAAIFVQRRNAAKNLEKDIVKLDKIKEMYDDGVEIHKISQEGLPIEEPLRAFQKKYGTTDTQGIINQAKQEYAQVQEDILQYNPDKPIVEGTETPVGLNLQFDSIEKTLHNIGSSQMIAVEAEEMLKNQEVGRAIHTMFEKAGVYNFFSPFYQNFPVFLKGIKDISLKTMFTMLYYGGYYEFQEEIIPRVAAMANVLKDPLLYNEDKYLKMIENADNLAKLDLQVKGNPTNNTVSNPFSFSISNPFTINTNNAAYVGNVFTQQLETAKDLAVSVGSSFVGVANYLDSFLHGYFEEQKIPEVVGITDETEYKDYQFSDEKSTPLPIDRVKFSDVSEKIPSKLNDIVDESDVAQSTKKQTTALDFPELNKNSVDNAVGLLTKTNAINSMGKMDIDNSKNYYTLTNYGINTYNKIDGLLKQNTIESVEEATKEIETLKEITAQLALAAYSTKANEVQNINEGLAVANNYPESKAAELIRDQEAQQTPEYTSFLNGQIDSLKDNLKFMNTQLEERIGAVNPEITKVYQFAIKNAYYASIADDAKLHSFDLDFENDLDFMNIPPAEMGQDSTITKIKIRQYKNFVNLMEIVNTQLMNLLNSNNDPKANNVEILKYLMFRTGKLKDIGAMPTQKSKWNWYGVAQELFSGAANVVSGAASAATAGAAYAATKSSDYMKWKASKMVGYGLNEQMDYDNKIKNIKKGKGIENIPILQQEAKNYIRDLMSTKLDLIEMQPIHRVVDTLNSMPPFKMGGLKKKPTYGCGMCGTKAGKGKRFFVHDKNNKDITCSNCFGEHGMTGGRVTERDANFNFIEASQDPEHVQMTEDQKTNDYLDEVENIKPTTAFEDFDASANIDKRFLDRMSSDFVVNRPYDYRKSFEQKDLDRLAYLVGMHEHASEQMTTSQKANMEALAINHLDRYKDPQATFVNPNKLTTFGGTRTELQQNPGFLKRYLQ